MRALVFDNKLQLRDIPELQPLSGEALIRPHLVGICATDLHITRGYNGFRGVLGHEWVGTVVACGQPDWIGQRVVGEINAACRECPTCLRGDLSHCPHRTALGILGRNGAMAELFSLPAANLHAVPPSLSDEEAVFTEPLAAALAIVEQTHIRPTDRVAVVGDGKLGLLVAQVLRLNGCDLTVVGRHPERWDVLERHRISCTTDLSALAARSYDVAVDCTGSPDGIEAARHLVRPRGRIVLKSTFCESLQLNISSFVVDEIEIIGSRCGPFAAALRLLQRGLIETAPLISAIYRLDEAEQAFAAAQGALKVLVRV
jgi:alcohol dehydrogenase